jgi:hypothetical protein
VFSIPESAEDMQTEPDTIQQQISRVKADMGDFYDNQKWSHIQEKRERMDDINVNDAMYI